jgi:hypothetical protein
MGSTPLVFEAGDITRTDSARERLLSRYTSSRNWTSALFGKYASLPKCNWTLSISTSFNSDPSMMVMRARCPCANSGASRFQLMSRCPSVARLTDRPIKVLRLDVGPAKRYDRNTGNIKDTQLTTTTMETRAIASPSSGRILFPDACELWLCLTLGSRSPLLGRPSVPDARTVTICVPGGI